MWRKEARQLTESWTFSEDALHQPALPAVQRYGDPKSPVICQWLNQWPESLIPLYYPGKIDQRSISLLAQDDSGPKMIQGAQLATDLLVTLCQHK
jgi:hypothetical protein